MSQYAYCSASIAPLRPEASDASEMISQLLFGEPVEVLEENNQWRKVRSLLDNYEGWTDFKLLGDLREKECKRWMDGLGTELAAWRIIEGPFGKQYISCGSSIPDTDETEFSIGKNEYRFVSEEDPLEAQDRTGQIIELGLRFLNAPYLWGGKSILGIDCSGLIQNVFRCVGMNLPRDAYEQEEHGMDVSYEERKPGDLVYFINTKGKVHHVGILVTENEIIHAHGFVRIDDLTEKGIVRRTDGVLSHAFHSIKRLF